MKLADALGRPGPWIGLAAGGLFAAVCLTTRDPDWLFWGATGASCLGAFVAAVLARLRDRS